MVIKGDTRSLDYSSDGTCTILSSACGPAKEGKGVFERCSVLHFMTVEACQ